MYVIKGYRRNIYIAARYIARYWSRYYISTDIHEHQTLNMYTNNYIEIIYIYYAGIKSVKHTKQ